MISETLVAYFLLLCVGCFVSVNLHNILKAHKRKSEVQVYAEVERPEGLAVGLAAAGTGVYFIEVLAYLFLVFSGLFSTTSVLPFASLSSFRFYAEALGLILTGTGYFLFIWSVIVRGRYAVSWEMPENQRLVKRGPYHHVRHPSYLGYFLMFVGLFFVWPNLFTILPLSAIPGYLRVTSQEEKLLVRRFGEQYIEYQKKTGRFIPKLW